MKRNLVFVLLMVSLMVGSVSAGLDCPYGLVDDPYPGDCGIYIDSNENALCDHSQEVLESSEPVVLERIENAASESEMIYHLVPISVFLVALYFLSVWMTKSKFISLLMRKQFWNILLLSSFVVSGALGVLLILRINTGVDFGLPFDILFWHVDVGIALLVLCIIHAIERWRCFLW